MIKLLNIEFKKILTYKTFWILIGLYFLFLALGIIMAEYILNSMVNDMNRRLPLPLPHVTLYFFPDIWQNLTFFASIRYVLILPAIIVIILITNEFTNKTIRQNIINGMSKNEFLNSKLLFILVLSIFITIVVSLIIWILGVSHSDAQGMALIWHKISFLPAFFVEMLTFLILAFFFGFMLRNTGLSIALFTLYCMIIEPVIYYILKIPPLQPNHISTYLPVNVVIRIVEYPSIPILQKVMGLNLQENASMARCGLALLYSAVMIGVVYMVMHRKDL
jgi:ABC-2 type transport system permease protein